MVEKRTGWAMPWKKALHRTSALFSFLWDKKVADDEKAGDEFLSELEDALILSNMGVDLASQIVKSLRREVHAKNLHSKQDILELASEKLIRLLPPVPKNELYREGGMNVYVFAGVNGTGKTTFLAKFADWQIKRGRKVIAVCADTFRAGALEQICILGSRVGFEVVGGKQGDSPASVVFQGIKRAVTEDVDCVLVDTAGRMQTKKSLMDELGKISRSVQKAFERFAEGGVSQGYSYQAGLSSGTKQKCMHQINLLVVDATTGLNAIEQAKLFSEVVKLTGIVINKIDATQRAGIIFPIVEATGLPVLFVGCGEELGDILWFDAKAFIDSLFG